jgi:hypothetical protein
MTWFCLLEVCCLRKLPLQGAQSNSLSYLPAVLVEASKTRPVAVKLVYKEGRRRLASFLEVRKRFL